LAAKHFIGLYNGLKCDACGISANYFPLSMQFLNFNHKTLACKRIYSTSIHMVCYFFLLLFYFFYKGITINLTPGSYREFQQSIVCIIMCPSVETPIKNRVQLL